MTTLASSGTDSYTPVDLLAGDAEVITGGGTIAAGNNVAQYTVLGRVAASGEYVPWNPAATDGSEKAVAIAAEAVDASAAAKACPIYLAGMFNSAVLVFTNGTAAQQAVAFDGTSIFTRSVRYSG